MKIKQHYSILSFIALVGGIFFFAIYNKWIIFTISNHIKKEEYAHAINKKNVSLFYFTKNKWRSEKSMLLWSHSNAENLSHLIQAWLILLDEEKITSRKINLEAALISQAEVAYLSFDHTLFSKEDALYKKWMLIESLLKTIYEAQLSLCSVQLLVHHQHMQDYHLDFSKPWPIHGFIIEQKRDT